jgi:hypothetical protein
VVLSGEILQEAMLLSWSGLHSGLTGTTLWLVPVGSSCLWARHRNHVGCTLSSWKGSYLCPHFTDEETEVQGQAETG